MLGAVTLTSELGRLICAFASINSNGEVYNFKMVTKNSKDNTQPQYLSKGIYESHPLNLTSNPTTTLQANNSQISKILLYKHMS